MKTWTTIKEEEIPYNKLKDNHLLNILKFIKRRAEDGVEVFYGWGYDGDDDFPTGDVDVIYGRDVLKHFDYVGLVKEARKRGYKIK